MDLNAELERFIEQVEGDQGLSNALNEILGDIFSLPALSPAPPPPPTAAHTIEPGFDTFPVHPLSGGYALGIPPGAAPHSLEQPIMSNTGQYVGPTAPTVHQDPLHQNIMQSGFLYDQAGPLSQGQYLPTCYQLPVYNLPQPYASLPPVMPPQGVGQILVPVTVLNGDIVYGLPGITLPPASIAPPLETPASKKGKRASQDNEDIPYVKKPPNAFMIFRKEQRAKVVAELNVTECATVNTVLGQKWKSLPDAERAKYFEQAQREKLCHAEQFPEWSARDNYGKKRKRIRSKAPTNAEASASTAKEVTQLAKRLCVTSVQTAAIEPSPTRTDVMEASHRQTNVTEAPPSWPDVIEAPPSWPDVMEAFHRQTNVTEAPPSWTDMFKVSPRWPDVIEAPPSWPDVIEAPPSWPDVIEAPPSWPDMFESPSSWPDVIEAPPSWPDMFESPSSWPDVIEAPPSWTDVIEAPHAQTNVMEASHTQPDVTETQVVESESDFWDMVQMLEKNFPTASAATPVETTAAEPFTSLTGATKTPEIGPKKDCRFLPEIGDMNSPAASTSTSEEVPQRAKRLCATPGWIDVKETPLIDTSNDFWSLLQLYETDSPVQLPLCGPRPTGL